MEAVGETKNFLERVDFVQAASTRHISEASKADFEQYFSSVSLARLMASMFRFKDEHVRILDPGAGVGMLFAATVEAALQNKYKPQTISVTAYEIDTSLADDIKQVFDICEEACKKAGVEFRGNLILKDFVADIAERIALSTSELQTYTHSIMNPPYQEISATSEVHRTLAHLGIDSPNLYTVFMELASRSLEEVGEMVTVTPRSFCNGLYFKSFRKRLLDFLAIDRIHLFTSRSQSFRQDEVLQENIILHSVRDKVKDNVVISSSEGPGDPVATSRIVPFSELVHPNDSEFFVRIVADEIDQQIAKRMDSLKASLPDLGLEISTGKVVDFRSPDNLRYHEDQDTVPLIHPLNLNAGGFVKWPISDGKKPAYFEQTEKAKPLLVPRGTYVLVKRFTTNEERKRIVAAVYDSAMFDSPFVAFENRVNYFHRNGEGFEPELAKGLALFLNSTTVDSFFRQFSGHTQVNSTDLRSLRYPTADELGRLGSYVGNAFPEQKQIDDMVERELFSMPRNDSVDPIAAKQKIAESLSILRQLDLPREQQNERSALTLLSILDLKPGNLWSDAKQPLMGITPMMEFFAKYYGKKYAPNSRETVRRFTVHQFCQAGIAVENPDEPDRPTNSPKAVYQIEKKTLGLLRKFGTAKWDASLREYRASVKSLREKYAMEKEKRMIPVRVGEDKEVNLPPGGQNVLVQKIVEVFIPEFVQDGKVLYVGDTAEKFALFEREDLEELGVRIEPHGKMPDVIAYSKKKNWLFLIEAVTSHGPVNPKRREELSRIFGKAKAGIVYVTAFLDRADMVSFLRDISWETEVWVAESPSHMIHFNGTRFLGPYE